MVWKFYLMSSGEGWITSIFSHSTSLTKHPVMCVIDQIDHLLRLSNCINKYLKINDTNTAMLKFLFSMFSTLHLYNKKWWDVFNKQFGLPLDSFMIFTFMYLDMVVTQEGTNIFNDFNSKFKSMGNSIPQENHISIQT